MESTDILYLLRQGRFDDVVDEIFSIARQRILVVAGRRSEMLKVGDDVILNGRTNPKVLAGATGEVTKVGKTTVWVRLYDSYGKQFPALCTIEVPNTVVEFA